jgi:hypothetical protein
MKGESTMKMMILHEAGYDQAALGVSLSYGTTVAKAKEVMESLAIQDGGHNKFLEFIVVWLDITAPRYWWQEADTYRMSTKQSASTMHTMHRFDLSQDDFEYPIDEKLLNTLNKLIEVYRKSKKIEDLLTIKNLLPEGFLQRRIWVVNYKTLRNILLQRSDHKLPEWRECFCPYIKKWIKHPSLLPR